MYTQQVTKVHSNCSYTTFLSTFLAQLFERFCCSYVPPHFTIKQCPAHQQTPTYSKHFKHSYMMLLISRKHGNFPVGKYWFWLLIGWRSNNKQSSNKLFLWDSNLSQQPLWGLDRRWQYECSYDDNVIGLFCHSNLTLSHDTIPINFFGNLWCNFFLLFKTSSV